MNKSSLAMYRGHPGILSEVFPVNVVLVPSRSKREIPKSVIRGQPSSEIRTLLYSPMSILTYGDEKWLIGNLPLLGRHAQCYYYEGMLTHLRYLVPNVKN